MKRPGEWTAVTVAIAAAAVAAHATAQTPNDPRGTAVPEADLEVVTPPGKMTEAIRAVFPEAYSQFMTVSYERQVASAGRPPQMWPKAATFLVPAAAYDDTVAGNMEARVSDLVATVLRPGDAHCETFEVGEPEDYAWIGWPDRRVREIAIQFNVAC